MGDLGAPPCRLRSNCPVEGPSQAAMNVLSIQPTPNPNAFKFVVDQILHHGTKNFANAEEAASHELATEMFGIDGVAGLFLCDKFVTVTMTLEADWRAVHEQITKILEGASGTSDAPPTGDAAETTVGFDPSHLAPEDQELLGKINEILDDRVRPALAGDGGGLQVIGLDGKTLMIRYEGACGSCPSSIAGTLVAIQNLLQSEVDETLAVVSA